jgi:hypothetical protein
MNTFGGLVSQRAREKTTRLSTSFEHAGEPDGRYLSIASRWPSGKRKIYKISSNEKLPAKKKCQGENPHTSIKYENDKAGMQMRKRFCGNLCIKLVSRLTFS